MPYNTILSYTIICYFVSEVPAELVRDLFHVSPVRRHAPLHRALQRADAVDDGHDRRVDPAPQARPLLGINNDDAAASTTHNDNNITNNDNDHNTE